VSYKIILCNKFNLFWTRNLFLYEASQGVDVSSTNQHAGYGVKSGVDLASMEKAQPLSDHPLAIDAVSFITLINSGLKDGRFNRSYWGLFKLGGVV